MSRVNEKIGAWLLEGHTRDELAKGIGMSRPTLRSRIEGRSEWKWSEVVKVAEVTGSTLDELAGMRK